MDGFKDKFEEKPWFCDTPDCNQDEIVCTMEFVDCSQRGGYDPSDPCKHTCMDESEEPECLPLGTLGCSSSSPCCDDLTCYIDSDAGPRCIPKQDDEPVEFDLMDQLMNMQIIFDIYLSGFEII